MDDKEPFVGPHVEMLSAMITGLSGAWIELVGYLAQQDPQIGIQMHALHKERAENENFHPGMRLISRQLSSGLELLGVAGQDGETDKGGADE